MPPGSVPTLEDMSATQTRTQAYTRVIRTLDELGPTKLHSDEQELIRESADTLIFAASPSEAHSATGAVTALSERLTGSGRWSSERADALVADLLACGPVEPVG